MPPFPYRDTNYWMFTRNPAFAAVHHLNGNMQSNLDASYGGFRGYLGGFGHTFYSLLSPDAYFDAHPEYFSMVNGERRPKSQLCLTNPEVLEIVTERVRALLSDAPENRRIVSITQMDWPFWCECPKCAALDEREGSHAGTLIHFVNAVAEAIEPEFPDALIDTFAYTYTRKPPKHVRPRDNVIVRLCSIECDFSRPLADRDSELNRAFREGIEDWSKTTKNLFIWDYTQNWHAFQGPHPNMHVLQPNIAFYRDHGVTGMFEQAAHSPGADFDYLKAYIVGRALWNPDLDGAELYDEFMSLYYGPAAPHLRAYHDLLLDKVRGDDYKLTIFSEMEWMDAGMVRRARALFDKAFAAVADKPELRARVERASLSLEYAALVCPPEIEVEGDRFLLRRPPSLTFDEYWAMLERYEVTHLQDTGIEMFRERLGGETPPRYREAPFVRLENERYEVWVVPEAAGRVVRLRDKDCGVDWLAAYESPITGAGALEEWTLVDPQAPVMEHPAIESFEVVAQAEHSLTLETTIRGEIAGLRPEDTATGPMAGLVVRRSLELGPDALEITLELRNPTANEIVPRIKVHPEFEARGKREPVFFVRRGGAWQKQKPDFIEPERLAAGRFDAGEVSALAVYMRPPGCSLIAEAGPGEASSLLYFYDPGAGHINLETVPELTSLAPGESRSLRVRYRTVPGRPR